MDDKFQIIIIVVLVIVILGTMIYFNNDRDKLKSIISKNESMIKIYDLEMKTMQETIIMLENKNKELKESNTELLEFKEKKETPKISRSEPKKDNKEYLGVFDSTAYDLSVASCGKAPDHPEYGITRSGTKAREGVVAVDPNVIPLGTKLYIEGIGNVVAEDSGGAIKGRIIDIFMPNNQDCKDWGRREIKVWIVK